MQGCLVGSSAMWSKCCTLCNVPFSTPPACCYCIKNPSMTGSKLLAECLVNKGGGDRKKFLIPGYNVIFAGKARDPHPLRKFFPYICTQNFL